MNPKYSPEQKPVEPLKLGRTSEWSTVTVEVATSLRHISDILVRSAIKHSAPGGRTMETSSWMDEEYLYVDVTLSASDELMMDVCVHEGRAFIRAARGGLGLELVDAPR